MRTGGLSHIAALHYNTGSILFNSGGASSVFAVSDDWERSDFGVAYTFVRLFKQALLCLMTQTGLSLRISMKAKVDIRGKRVYLCPEQVRGATQLPDIT